MNKYSLAVLSLFCTALFADRDPCFNRYPSHFSNQSGGDAVLIKTDGIGGACRNTLLESGETIRPLIQKRGATIEVKFGPENHKTTKEITFFSKHFNAYQPSVTLTPKGILAAGFYQKPITYNVKIENNSGGIARILDSCATSPSESTIPQGKTMSLTAKPSSFIIVEFGPENQKIKPKIVFGEQTGEHPLLTLEKRGFTSRGIQHQDVDIIGQRVPLKRVPLLSLKKKEVSVEPIVAKRIKPRKMKGRTIRSSRIPITKV